ncbi:hypothetical protein ACNKXS_15075, partial [Christiangramia marina]|uniref:hypothetical protein n=1 Tax=Christiangramia marina TaxID=409436 RepID=UPI003AA8DFAE
FGLVTGGDAGGVWTDASDVSVSDPIDLSSYTAGTYVFTYTVSPEDVDSECPSDNTTVSITIDDSFEAGTGDSDRYCEDDTDLSSVSLFGLVTGGDAGGDWTDASDVSVSDPIDLSSYTAGTYEFTYTVGPEDADSECAPDNTTVTIIIDGTVEAGTGGSDRYCEDDTDLSSVSLFGLVTGGDAGGVWTDASDVSVSDPIDLSSYTAGTYEFTYTVSPEDVDSECPSDNTTVSITIDDSFEAGTGDSDRYCEDDTDLSSVSLFGLVTGGDAGGVWTDASDASVSDPIDLSSYTAGTYEFTYTVSPEDADSECVSDNTTVTIIIDGTVEAGTGGSDRFCIDEDLSSVSL